MKYQLYNYIKAVIKGLRWSFFDIELLAALDRLYRNERQRLAEVSTKKAQLTIAISASKPSPQPLLEPSISPLNTSSTTTSNPSTREAPESDRPKKKRKKYQVNQDLLETVTTTNVTKDGTQTLNVASLLAATIDTTSISKTEAGNNMLLSRGGSPSYPSGYPLVRACQRGDIDMVRLLLSHGAPPEVKALRWACVEEHDEVLDIFLEVGVKPDQECLKRCVEMGKFKMTNRLLELGVYPAYASYKAINSGDNTRLTAWLMYWSVMGIFSLAEFVLDTFVFWFPFYYEVKVLFVLWMVLPQTQGSIYLYQAFIDPYLTQHEREIDQTLKDIQKRAMAMGMQYIKQAIQLIQNLLLDLYKKSQSQAGVSSMTDKDSSTDRSVPYDTVPQHDTTSHPATDPNIMHPPAQGYFSWAYHVVSPKLAAAAIMASEKIAQRIPARPLPQTPVNLYSARATSPSPTTSTDSSSSHESSHSSHTENMLGIRTTSVSTTERSQLELLSSRLDRASQSTAVESTKQTGPLRYRKISLYEDEEMEDNTPTTSAASGGHVSERS
ncbi:hypothetical protein BG011_005196 [Mortierella polycephala]|uniref:Protein YOP1 n=1 Tax=Mortierella polycephala TaxID=41804 RepID=A0A9P6U1N4_9FUNG|nr:hypothetical protein BG011_005196 [Mortierella polycephala]